MCFFELLSRCDRGFSVKVVRSGLSTGMAGGEGLPAFRLSGVDRGVVKEGKEEQPSLGQLIWLVRRELEWAYAVDRDQPLRFDVGSVELEVTVEATRSTTGGGGLDLKVVGVGASGELSRENKRGTTSNVHVTMTPVDTRTGNRRYQISAVDTEPPPRRADSGGEQGAARASPGEHGSASQGGGWAGMDTEPPANSLAASAGEVA